MKCIELGFPSKKTTSVGFSIGIIEASTDDSCSFAFDKISKSYHSESTGSENAFVFIFRSIKSSKFDANVGHISLRAPVEWAK